MLLGARTAAFSSVNQEEEMYKELFNSLLDGSITEINSDVTFLRNQALTGLSNLTSVNLPNCTTVYNGMRIGGSNLSYINLPSYVWPVGSVGDFIGSIKEGCEIHLDSLTELNTTHGQFIGNSFFIKIYLPSVTYLSGKFCYGGGRHIFYLPLMNSDAVKNSNGFPFSISDTTGKSFTFRCSDGILKWSSDDNEWVVEPYS